MGLKDRPTWLPVGWRVDAYGYPFCPLGGGHPCALPLAIAPEHRTLPHWSAVNDPK